MNEPIYTVIINQLNRHNRYTKIYELRHRKTNRILNGNRFMFNAVIKQIQTEKRKAEYQKNLDMLNLLLS